MVKPDQFYSRSHRLLKCLFRNQTCFLEIRKFNKMPVRVDVDIGLVANTGRMVSVKTPHATILNTIDNLNKR